MPDIMLITFGALLHVFPKKPGVEGVGGYYKSYLAEEDIEKPHNFCLAGLILKPKFLRTSLIGLLSLIYNVSILSL